MTVDSLPTPLASGSVLANILLLKALAAAFVLMDAYVVYRLLLPEYPRTKTPPSQNSAAYSARRFTLLRPG